LNDYLLIAHITSIAGSEGFLNLKIISDFPDKLFGLKEVYIDFFGSKKKIWVEKTQQSSKSFRIKFMKFETIRELQVLIGRDVFINETLAAELPEGNYFIHDLIDTQVWQENKLLGTIKDVLTLPANDVFVIVDEHNREILIPFVLSFIENFDKEKKQLILKPGAGKYEDDES
jgi:16S rRNA processing protein RimM